MIFRVVRRLPRVLALFALTATLLSARQARARFITLIGSSNLAIHDGSGTRSIVGEYRIRNAGDEVARKVFLSLRLGGWTYATSEADIAPGLTHAFSIQAAIAASELGCSSSSADLCAGLPLPQIGRLPLRITIHYQDAQAYPLSSVAVERIDVGNLTPEQKNSVQATPITLSLNMRYLSDRNYEAVVGLRSLSEVAESVAVSVLTAREFSVDLRPFAISLPPGGRVERRIRLTNHAALPGGAYAVVAIAQGEAAKARYVSLAWATAAIAGETPGRSRAVLLGTLILGSIGLLLVVVLIWRTRRSAPTVATRP